MTPTASQRLLLAAGLALAPLAAWSQLSIAVTIAPPPLPIYEQPPIPGDGYLWTPGYWAWDPNSGDYVWVPGAWVRPPEQGLLWTPGWWGWANGGYLWHRGYWGRHVGYYGGIDYGHGYWGRGYAGGRWDHGRLRYNAAANNIPSGRVHHVYRAPVPHGSGHRDSFVGGTSHHHAGPDANERHDEARPHRGATPDPAAHERHSFESPGQRLGNNHGVPPMAATPRADGFDDRRGEHDRAGHDRHDGHVNPAPQARPQVQARPQLQARPQPPVQPHVQARPPMPAPQMPMRPQAPPQPHAEPPMRAAPPMHAQPVRPPPGMARPEGHEGRPQGEPHGGEHHGRQEGDRR